MYRIENKLYTQRFITYVDIGLHFVCVQHVKVCAQYSYNTESPSLVSYCQKPDEFTQTRSLLCLPTNNLYQQGSSWIDANTVTFGIDFDLYDAIKSYIKFLALEILNHYKLPIIVILFTTNLIFIRYKKRLTLINLMIGCE